MVKESIIMTVADRPPSMLLETLRHLSNDALEESEIIIVNDCSSIPYGMKDGYGGLPLRWIDMEPYECWRMAPDPEFPDVQTYNNPAKAFNRGLAEAQGEHVVILSSDVLVPPQTLMESRKYDGENILYCPYVHDLIGSPGLEVSNQYCGPNRVFPMPWFLRVPRQACLDIGGWDENYLLGLCYEDNDFVGRLALTLKGFLLDWGSVVYHNSHIQPAYRIDNHVIASANQRNRQYTMDKWTGIPFDRVDNLAFQMKRGTHESGLVFYEFKDIKEVRQKVMDETRSSLDHYTQVPS